MPRSYGYAMAEATEGSPGDVIFAIAGFIIFFLYRDIYEKIKKLEPDNVKLLLATLITLFIVPFMWLFYLVIFFFAWSVVNSVWEVIKKH